MAVTARHRERTIVRSLLRFLKRSGWTLTRGFDGEEHQRISSEKEALDLFDSVDQSVLFFMRANEMKPGQVLLIMGNRDEVISDYGGPPNFTRLLDNFLDTL